MKLMLNLLVVFLAAGACVALGTSHGAAEAGARHGTPGAQLPTFASKATRDPHSVALLKYWNSVRNDHLYITDFNKLKTGEHNYAYQGVVAYVYNTQVNGTIPVYQYFFRDLVEHVYSTDNLPTEGFRTNEGVAWYAFPKDSTVRGTSALHAYKNPTVHDQYLTTDYSKLGNGKGDWKYLGSLARVWPVPTQVEHAVIGDGSTVAIRKFFNPYTADHVLTYESPNQSHAWFGWVYQGVSFYGLRDQEPGTVPLRLYYSTITKDHLATANPAMLPSGNLAWTYEGDLCYVWLKPHPGAVPLFRYYNAELHDHYYTLDKNTLKEGTMGWVYQGIECYVLPHAEEPTPALPSFTVEETAKVYSWFNPKFRAHFYSTDANAMSGGVKASFSEAQVNHTYEFAKKVEELPQVHSAHHDDHHHDAHHHDAHHHDAHHHASSSSSAGSASSSSSASSSAASSGSFSAGDADLDGILLSTDPVDAAVAGLQAPSTPITDGAAPATAAPATAAPAAAAPAAEAAAVAPAADAAAAAPAAAAAGAVDGIAPPSRPLTDSVEDDFAHEETQTAVVHPPAVDKEAALSAPLTPIQNAWVEQGPAFLVFKNREEQTTPLYVIFNHMEMDYLYTTHYRELELIRKSHWATYKGVVGNIGIRQLDATVPLYRYWSPKTGDHFLSDKILSVATDGSTVATASPGSLAEENDDPREHHALAMMDLLLGIRTDPHGAADAHAEEEHAGAEHGTVESDEEAELHDEPLHDGSDSNPDGYVYDGILGFIPSPSVFNAAPGSGNSITDSYAINLKLTPIYQFWNPSAQDHWYTTDPAYDKHASHTFGDSHHEPKNPNSDLEKAVRASWYFQGSIGYCYSRKSPGTVPLYRFHNTAAGDHAYTTAEKEFTPENGWKYDGIECFVHDTRVPGTVGLLRYYDPLKRDHLYVTNGGKEVPVGYKLQGVQAYVFPSAVVTDDPLSTVQAVVMGEGEREREREGEGNVGDEDPAEVVSHAAEAHL